MTVAQEHSPFILFDASPEHDSTLGSTVNNDLSDNPCDQMKSTIATNISGYFFLEDYLR